MGTALKAGPSAMTATARSPTPAAAPDAAVRQPRVAPTASTIVRASTNSTKDAKKLGMPAESATFVIEE